MRDEELGMVVRRTIHVAPRIIYLAALQLLSLHMQALGEGPRQSRRMDAAQPPDIKNLRRPIILLRRTFISHS